MIKQIFFLRNPPIDACIFDTSWEVCKNMYQVWMKPPLLKTNITSLIVGCLGSWLHGYQSNYCVLMGLWLIEGIMNLMLGRSLKINLIVWTTAGGSGSLMQDSEKRLAGMQYLWKGGQGLSISWVNKVQNEDGLLTSKLYTMF